MSLHWQDSRLTLSSNYSSAYAPPYFLPTGYPSHFAELTTICFGVSLSPLFCCYWGCRAALSVSSWAILYHMLSRFTSQALAVGISRFLNNMPKFLTKVTNRLLLLHDDWMLLWKLSLPNTSSSSWVWKLASFSPYWSLAQHSELRQLPLNMSLTWQSP